MDIVVLERGFVLGFAIAAPVGPIGVLVIRRALSHGTVAGLATGLGAAVADAAYAALAASGVAAGSFALTSSPAFRWLAAGLLVWLGLRTLRSPVQIKAQAQLSDRVGHARAFASTVALTLANPSTVVSFAAASAAIGASRADASARGFVLQLAGSVLAGSAAWWLALCVLSGALRAHVSPRALRLTQTCAGLSLLGFALLALYGGP